MGVLNIPVGVLKKVNGGIEKIRWGYCVGSMGERDNGGIEKTLVRANGGTEQSGLNGGIEKDEWGHWSGSMGGQGQRGH